MQHLVYEPPRIMVMRTSENSVKARVAPGKREIAANVESYGRLLLLHQLLHGHAVCPGDLRHGRHVGISLAGLQVDQGPVRYLGKLRCLLVRKTPLLPNDPKLQRDRSRHHCVLLLIRGPEPLMSPGPESLPLRGTMILRECIMMFLCMKNNIPLFCT